MAPADSALQPPPGEDIGDGDLPGQFHRVFRWQDMQRCTEANAAGLLSDGAEEGQGVGRDTKLLREVMVDGGVNIEAHLIRMFNLAEDFPVELFMWLLGRTLHFCIHAKTHHMSSLQSINSSAEPSRK